MFRFTSFFTLISSSPVLLSESCYTCAAPECLNVYLFCLLIIRVKVKTALPHLPTTKTLLPQALSYVSLLTHTLLWDCNMAEQSLSSFLSYSLLSLFLYLSIYLLLRVFCCHVSNSKRWFCWHLLSFLLSFSLFFYYVFFMFLFSSLPFIGCFFSLLPPLSLLFFFHISSLP